MRPPVAQGASQSRRCRGPAYRPTSGIRDQGTVALAIPVAAHLVPGSVFRGSAFRPTHFGRIGTKTPSG